MGTKRKGIVTKEGRECTKCGEFKPWSSYVKNKNGTNGYSSQCKLHFKKELKDWSIKEGAGVYIIYTTEGEYIGESSRITQRISGHRWPSNHASPVNHSNYIRWELLEQVDNYTLRKEREAYWIKKLKPKLNTFLVK